MICNSAAATRLPQHLVVKDAPMKIVLPDDRLASYKDISLIQHKAPAAKPSTQSIDQTCDIRKVCLVSRSRLWKESNRRAQLRALQAQCASRVMSRGSAVNVRKLETISETSTDCSSTGASPDQSDDEQSDWRL
jgi:hypothetical protein